MRTREDVGWLRYLQFVRAGVPSADEEVVWQGYASGVSVNRVLEHLGSSVGAAAQAARSQIHVPKPVESQARSVAIARRRPQQPGRAWNWTHVAVEAYPQQALSEVPDAPPAWIEWTFAKRVPAWRAVERARERSFLATKSTFDDRAFAHANGEDLFRDAEKATSHETQKRP